VHWLVRMKWHPDGWSVCLPLLISRCTIVQKFSSGTGSPGWSRKRAVKRLWCGEQLYLVGMLGMMYIAPVAHIEESFGGKGEAGKHNV